MVRWHGCVCSRARTTPPWCCLCAVVLLVLAAPAAAVGQHVPAVFSEMTSQQPPSDGWIDRSQCETHSQCAAGKFCKWKWANSFEGWWFVGGICTPCFECECNGDAVDASCPRERCPLQPSREIRFLQGSFTQFRNLSGSAICVYTLDIQGSQFRETQLVLEHASSSSFLPDPIAQIAAMVAAGAVDGMPTSTKLGGGHTNYGGPDCSSFMSAGVIQLLG